MTLTFFIFRRKSAENGQSQIDFGQNLLDFLWLLYKIVYETTNLTVLNIFGRSILILKIKFLGKNKKSKSWLDLTFWLSEQVFLKALSLNTQFFLHREEAFSSLPGYLIAFSKSFLRFFVFRHWQEETEKILKTLKKGSNRKLKSK